MDGKTLRAGAVAFVRHVKNPIKLARLVMEKTEHVLLAGEGANEFAREMKVEFETDDYFFTDFRHEQLLQARAENRIQLDHSIDKIRRFRIRQTQIANRESQTNRHSRRGRV